MFANLRLSADDKSYHCQVFKGETDLTKCQTSYLKSLSKHVNSECLTKLLKYSITQFCPLSTNRRM